MSVAAGLREQLDEVLEHAELEQHRAGWDNTPATLFWVGRQSDGEGLTLMPARLGGVAHPATELEAIAEGVERGEGAGALLVQRMNELLPVIAHMLVMECWQRQQHAGEDSLEDAKRAYGTGKFADMPGSVEGRIGLAVMGKYEVVVNRQRGSDPVWTRSDVAAWGGRMFESLRKLHAAARAARTL